ncbi:MAG: hypothetical protein WDN44_02810 [Sphingomonas sp.]
MIDDAHPALHACDWQRHRSDRARAAPRPSPAIRPLQDPRRKKRGYFAGAQTADALEDGRAIGAEHRGHSIFDRIPARAGHRVLGDMEDIAARRRNRHGDSLGDRLLGAQSLVELEQRMGGDVDRFEMIEPLLPAARRDDLADQVVQRLLVGEPGRIVVETGSSIQASRSMLWHRLRHNRWSNAPTMMKDSSAQR